MFKQNYKIRVLAILALSSMPLSGCGFISGKDLSSGLMKVTNYSQAEVVFKEVSYGEAVGLVATPNFKVAASQVTDLLGMSMAQATKVQQVSGTVEANLPEVGVASSLGAQSAFAYTKLYIAACTDKCRIDINNPTTPNRLCTFDLSVGHSDPKNTVHWNSAINKMAELFWGRAAEAPGVSPLSATEMSTLLTLRDEVASTVVLDTNNPRGGTLPAFQTVCAAMALSPAALAQ